jgi:predicted NAD/FAD-binding protein
MNIAIVGSGISALVAARELHAQHQITVFEANDYIGGHTNTVDVETEEGHHAIDTGFIVFNDRTYPNFIRLMDELTVDSQPTIMSFSVKCQRTGLEYRGADLGGLFAQKRNLVNPRFYRLLYDLLRFNRLGNQLLSDSQSQERKPETVGSFLKRHRFSQPFIQQYFLPMGAAIWSASMSLFENFPIRFICEFYKNHGLLGISDRPQWRVIKGGSRSYIGPLTQPFAERIRLNQKVVSVRRLSDPLGAGNDPKIELTTQTGETMHFDHVVFGCHSDQALAILGDGATSDEREILGAFPYQKNIAKLHTQDDVLPVCREAWASWNYYNSIRPNESATVTYNMNILQSLETKTVFCVTLNDDDRIKDENVLRTFTYHHPTFNLRRREMQQRHCELINKNATSFCGAYWGNGFHEDGVVSAQAVAQSFAKAGSQC